MLLLELEASWKIPFKVAEFHKSGSTTLCLLQIHIYSSSYLGSLVSNSNSKWGHCVVYCRKFSLPQWDIMSSGGSVQSVANLAKGKDRGNVVNIQVSFIFISKC